jgi:hypothetical protein
LAWTTSRLKALSAGDNFYIADYGIKVEASTDMVKRRTTRRTMRRARREISYTYLEARPKKKKKKKKKKKNWAAIDSLMVNELQPGEYEVFLFQITVSAVHLVAIRPKGLWNVIESFPESSISFGNSRRRWKFF